MSPPVLELERLAFAHPGAAGGLAVAHLALGRGARVALTGPSGSGKTTLLGLIAGLQRPDRGEVRIEGVALGPLGESARRRLRLERIGFVFQDIDLIAHLSARENLLLPFRIGGRAPDRAARARAEALADRLGVGHALARRPGGLSQGERQRVAIARALVTGPALVLADEPTASLDPAGKAAAIEALFDAAGEAAVLAVTHDHALLDRFERVIDIADFRVAA